MHKLLEYICDELEEIERKAEKEGKLSVAEIDYADKLAHLKKNLLKAEEMMDDYDGESHYSSRYNYAYGRGRNAKRDAMGRYSRAEDDFRMELERLMHDAPNEQSKQKIQRMLSEM